MVLGFDLECAERGLLRVYVKGVLGGWGEIRAVAFIKQRRGGARIMCNSV